MRYDWYQTDGTVIVSFLTKGSKQEEVVVDILTDKLEVIRRIEGEDEDKVVINLDKKIDEVKSSYKLLNSKIEVSLAKLESERWPQLEKKDVVIQPKSVKNWDKIAGEGEEKESEEGDKAVNSLFQEIYKGADENTRRAMNKSFIESGGTVLSTNWSEVGAKPVEVQPPEGLEYKAYES